MRDHRVFVYRSDIAIGECDLGESDMAKFYVWVTDNSIEGYSFYGKENDMKPIVIDPWNEKCGKCGAPVLYTRGTGHIFQGASESYEDWKTIKHKYCPECGEKVERDKTTN